VGENWMVTDFYKIANDYFDAWNTQSSKKLFDLLSDDVKLVDWNIKASRRDAVVLANENIWKDVPDINATIIDIGISHANRAYCHIIIKSEKENVNISVIDVLSIRDNKIYRIDAYHNES
jgi:ketosteroid isomerase-like protein